MSDCNTCGSSGYLDISPTTYCDCPAGDFYELKDELDLQFREGLLDRGQCDDTGYVSSEAEDIFEGSLPGETPGGTCPDQDYAKGLLALEHTVKRDFHIHGTCDCEESIEDIRCNKCNSSGYVTTSPIRYCTCIRGLCYSSRWSEGMEIFEDKFPHADSFECAYECNKNVLNMDWLFLLPFYGCQDI